MTATRHLIILLVVLVSIPIGVGAQNESQCRIHFTVVRGQEWTQWLEPAWPEETVWWWDSEGTRKYPELCYAPLQKADFVVAWEKETREVAIFNGGIAPGPPVGAGCEPQGIWPTTIGIPPNADAQGPAEPLGVVPSNPRACQAFLIDASLSGREQTRTNRPAQSVVKMERISLALYRAPASSIGKFSKPITTVKKDRIPDFRKFARSMFEPAMKALQKEARRQRK